MDNICSQKRAKRCGACGTEGHDRMSCRVSSSKSQSSGTAIQPSTAGYNQAPNPKTPATGNSLFKTRIPYLIRLTNDQRDEILQIEVQTGVVFEYASRVAKEVRGA